MSKYVGYVSVVAAKMDKIDLLPLLWAWYFVFV